MSGIQDLENSMSTRIGENVDLYAVNITRDIQI